MSIPSLISRMQGREGASLAQIDEAMAGLHARFPEDYKEFLWRTNGATGFVSEEQYAIFWRVQELVPLNRAYGANVRVPGFCLFGSTGGGDAYAFDTREASLPVMLVPFVPMEMSHATVAATSFSGLFSVANPPAADPGMAEREVVEIKPVILGGDATALDNKMFLDRQKHIDYVNYWNDIIDSATGNGSSRAVK